MFVRRRGCRLQVVRAYRNENGKPTNESLGTVSVFDDPAKSAVSAVLTLGERRKLEIQIARVRAVVLAESHATLKKLAARAGDVTDAQLMDDKIYSALSKLSALG